MNLVLRNIRMIMTWQWPWWGQVNDYWLDRLASKFVVFAKHKYLSENLTQVYLGHTLVCTPAPTWWHGAEIWRAVAEFVEAFPNTVYIINCKMDGKGSLGAKIFQSETSCVLQPHAASKGSKKHRAHRLKYHQQDCGTWKKGSFWSFSGPGMQKEGKAVAAHIYIIQLSRRSKSPDDGQNAHATSSSFRMKST